ncbi:MAG: flavin reductase family protein [Alphaproteobacteria bacterium]
MQIEPRQFRDALGGFCTGVTVVTTRAADGELLGITASSFNSVSLAPPLVLFSLDRNAYSVAKFQQAGHFAVNVLAREQNELCMRFARPLGDKWSGVDFEVWQTGAPILPGCVSNFDCRTYAIYDGGDHLIFLGEVLRMQTQPDLDPMIYYRGGFHGLTDDG